MFEYRRGRRHPRGLVLACEPRGGYGEPATRSGREAPNARGPSAGGTDRQAGRSTVADAEGKAPGIGVRSRDAQIETADEGATSPSPRLPAPLERLQRAIAGLRDLDAASLSGDELAVCLRVLSRAAGAVAATESRVIAAATAAKVPEQVGAGGATEWLKQTLGTSGRQAKRRTELASGLRHLERTADALADGDITVEHAEQIARSAKKGTLGSPGETETRLLDAARRQDADRFRAEVSRREHAVDRDVLRRDELLAYSRRTASMARDDDGMWDLRARLDPVNGEYVKTALDAMTTLDGAEIPVALRRRPEQRTADALVAVARAAVEAGAPPVTGKVLPHVTVVVPWETIAPSGSDDAPGTHRDGDASGHAAGEAAWSGPLSADAVRRLCCDAGISRVVTSGRSQVLDVGREERTWTAPQRRAIVARDGHCRFPGCDRPAAWCEVHHVTFWADGGPTDIDNGVLLCGHHHHRCHEGRWTLDYEPASGRVTVTSPDGRRTLTSDPAGFGASGGARTGSHNTSSPTVSDTRESLAPQLCLEPAGPGDAPVALTSEPIPRARLPD